MVGINKQQVRVGMIGYQFMGKAHSHAYRDIPFFFDEGCEPIQQAIAGRNEEAVKEAASVLGYASYETDWRTLIERDDIDLVDIVTPNNTHTEMAIAALEAGKHVLCEKPLALSLLDAERMLEVAEKSNTIHMVSHNYRYAPAVQYAKKLIDEGRLGKIFHVRAQYLQDFIMDPSFPLVWRLKKEVTGSGALGDIGAHIIDLSRFLVGEMKEVNGMLETFVKQRPIGEMSGGLSASVDSEEMGEVTVDDAAIFMSRFENGALGIFEATRFAAGNRNANRFEINGEKGSIRWDLENMNNLEVFFTDDEEGLQGFRTINCTEEVHPYIRAYWPAGHIIGYEHTFLNMISELMKGIKNGYSPKPNFEDGAKNQAVLEAVQQSNETGGWVNIAQLREQVRRELTHS